MSHGWRIGRIPPSIAMWRAASIRRIGAGRWMGRWGDWSEPFKDFAFVNVRLRDRPITRMSDYASLIEPTALMALIEPIALYVVSTSKKNSIYRPTNLIL